MTTFYIYEVPGEKIGATHVLESRSQYNFDLYGIWPIVIEKMEGPDNPEFWKIVGDREWELAELNGYRKDQHYKVIREMGLNVKTRKGWTCGNQSENGKKRRGITFEQAEEIRSKYTGKYGEQAKLAKEYGIPAPSIWFIINNKYYTKP